MPARSATSRSRGRPPLTVIHRIAGGRAALRLWASPSSRRRPRSTRARMVVRVSAARFFASIKRSSGRSMVVFIQLPILPYVRVRALRAESCRCGGDTPASRVSDGFRKISPECPQVSWVSVRSPGGMVSVRLARSVPRFGPGAERFDVGGGAVAEPAVELGLVLELLAAQAGDDDEAAVQARAARSCRPRVFRTGRPGRRLPGRGPSVSSRP